MMNVRVAVICLVYLFSGVLSVHAENTRADMEKHIESMLPEKSRWALVAVDMESGNIIAEYGNSLHARLVPASLVKLLTTGAVMDYAERGGKDVRLVTKGVRVTRKKKRLVKRPYKKVVKISSGEQLERVLHDMNVHSRNGVAQSFADFLGESSYGPPATRTKGARAVVKFLNTFDLPPEGAIIADGSGLMRENRLTARFLALYLYQLGDKPWFDKFRETLPRPGMEGTVKKIGYTAPEFRVKTGHLDDVFALAGYGNDQDGRNFAFAFIVNVKKGNARDRNHSRGEVLRMLAEGELQEEDTAWYPELRPN